METFMNTFQDKPFRKLMRLISLIVIIIAMVSCSEDDKITVVNDRIQFDYTSLMAEEADVEATWLNDVPSSMEMAIYEVTNSADDTRPLVILSPGGAFTRWNREYDIETLAIDLARRGYAVGYLRYTVAGQDGDTYVRSLHDMMMAVQYFRSNAEELKIDPENIFTGGWSTGAQLAMYAGHASESEFESFEQEIIHTITDAAFEEHGFSPEEFQGVSYDIKGNLLLMPYAWDEDFFDADGPAVMMIANPESHFTDGTKMLGTFTLDPNTSKALDHIGPDLMFDRLVEAGYTDGGNLEMILTNPSDLTMSWNHINAHSLDPVYFNDIAEFFKRNMD